MFNLIISIIAIALVVVLAGASLYYGGDAFNSGSSDAKAATYINQAQQIQASATLFTANEGGAPVDGLISANVDLLGEYLSAVPEAPATPVTDWSIGEVGTGTLDAVFIEVAGSSVADDGITNEICLTVNEDGAGVVRCDVFASGQSRADIVPDSFADGDITDATDTAVVYMGL